MRGCQHFVLSLMAFITLVSHLSKQFQQTMGPTTRSEQSDIWGSYIIVIIRNVYFRI